MRAAPLDLYAAAAWPITVIDWLLRRVLSQSKNTMNDAAGAGGGGGAVAGAGSSHAPNRNAAAAIAKTFLSMASSLPPNRCTDTAMLRLAPTHRVLHP